MSYGYYSFAKCINVQKENENNEYIYTLQTADGEILKCTTKDILNHARTDLKVTNLVKDGKDKFKIAIDDDTIFRYTLLESSKTSEESERAFLKASLMGKQLTCDNSLEPNEVKDVSINSDLIITDRNNRLLNTIRTNKAIFIGNKRVDASINGDPITLKKIICNEAIIKNRCVFGNIIVNKTNPVRVIAKHVYLSHEFIDINTVDEILVYLANIIDNSFESRGDSTIEVDFNKFGIKDTDVLDRAVQLIYKKLEEPNEDLLVSATAYISFACSMFISTGYKFKELLNLADELIKCRYYAYAEREAVNKILINLKAGKRY